MTKTYDFGDALYFLRQGRTVTRTAWGEEIELELDGVGNIIAHSNDGDHQWVPTQEHILAEDWYDI